MTADDDAAIKAYGARILSILEARPALAEGKRNELAPRALPLSEGATTAWIIFHDDVEEQMGPGGDLAPIKGFAAKAAEQAAKIAGVITVFENHHAEEISAETMEGALTLMDWYLNEALRIQQSGVTDARLCRAADLLAWLQAQPDRTAAFREILQFGPNQTRTKAAAEEALAILDEHRWMIEVSARPHTVKTVK